MLGMVTENVLWPVAAAGVLALLWAVALIFWVLRQPQGNEKMREISKAIQEGAQAYLMRQYSYVAAIGVVIAVILIFVVSFKAAILFVIGAVLSGAAGYIGMNISVRANLRTAEAARGGINPASRWPSEPVPSPGCSWSALASSGSPSPTRPSGTSPRSSASRSAPP